MSAGAVTLLCLVGSVIAAMAGYIAGRADERRRCLRITAGIKPDLEVLKHEFWKGYALCAEVLTEQIGGKL